MAIDTSLKFVSINIAVLTISDTRTTETDTSGALLQERINTAGHQCVKKIIIPDDVQLIKNTLQNLSKEKEATLLKEFMDAINNQIKAALKTDNEFS